MPQSSPLVASLFPPNLPEQVGRVVGVQEEQLKALQAVERQCALIAEQTLAPLVRDAQLIGFQRPGELSFVTSEKLYLVGLFVGGAEAGLSVLHSGEHNIMLQLFSPAQTTIALDLSGQKRLIVPRGVRLWWTAAGVGAWAAGLIAVPA